MRTRRHRHPVLEKTVFAAALLLAAFIGRELWMRRGAPAPEPKTIRELAVKLHPTYPDLPGERPQTRTEQAVTSVPPIKLTRVRPSKLKSESVPVPR